MSTSLVQWYGIRVSIFKKSEFSLEQLVIPDTVLKNVYLNADMGLDNESNMALLDSEKLAEEYARFCRAKLEREYNAIVQFDIIPFQRQHTRLAHDVRLQLQQIKERVLLYA